MVCDFAETEKKTARSSELNRKKRVGIVFTEYLFVSSEIYTLTKTLTVAGLFVNILIINMVKKAPQLESIVASAKLSILLKS